LGIFLTTGFMVRNAFAIVQNEAQGSTAIPQLLMPLKGSENLQNMLKFACTECCSALMQQLCLG
jgi:hypothetical protein